MAGSGAERSRVKNKGIGSTDRESCRESGDEACKIYGKMGRHLFGTHDTLCCMAGNLCETNAFAGKGLYFFACGSWLFFHRAPPLHTPPL